MAGTKANRHATKTDTLIRTVNDARQARGLDRHRIIPRVSQLPSGGGNNPAGGQHVGASGNFLDPTGDTMVGPIAFFPQPSFLDKSDPLNPTMDIGINSGDYTSYIFLTGNNDELRTILNASFSGQLLYLQYTGVGVLTIKQGDAIDGGNIVTNTGGDLLVNFGEVVTLLFDVGGGADPSVNGAWRVVAGGASSGAGGNAKTGFMLTSTGSTQVVASGASDTLDVFNIIVIQDGLTVNTTTNIITIQETGRYLFGLNLTLSADVNNTTADFVLVVNGTPLTNVNSVFLRGFGDNDGLYPAAPSDFTSGDTLEIRISHDKGVPVTFTFQECGFYLVKQEAGGGGGEGGATSLGELSDVTLTGPLLDQVLTFNGALWVNQAPQSGGMNTDLSNMISPTVPTVPLNMNVQDIDEVNSLDFANTGLQNITSLDTINFANNQFITDTLGGLDISVNANERVVISGGAGNIAVFDELNATDRRLDMQLNEVVNMSRIRFSPKFNTDISLFSQIYEETSFNNLRYVTKAGASHVFIQEGVPTLLTIGNFAGEGGLLQDVGLLNFNSIVGEFLTNNGDFQLDGIDMKVFSGGQIRNMSDIGAGGAGNSISQGNSSVTVIDAGAGSITDIIDGNVVSTKDPTNFSISQNVNFGGNILSGLGNTTPSATGVINLGTSTLFWKSVFSDEVVLGATTNIIRGDLPFGINYEVENADNHDFLVAGLTKFRVSGSLLNSTVNLDMGGSDIVNVDDITLNNSASILDMNGGNIEMGGGDINSVDDITFQSGTGSRLNMNGGLIINVNSITQNVSSGGIFMDGTFSHAGTNLGFFDQQTTIRRVVLNPQSTTNNELFTRLNDLINALGTINGFGIGLIDTQN